MMRSRVVDLIQLFKKKKKNDVNYYVSSKPQQKVAPNLKTAIDLSLLLSHQCLC